ncbi:MAG TPA: hypothetical protein VFU49_12980 [Ktedonobacteraceae bacterium]|nr:hypothetical protein [Ktedonobacteraceae bacterium]
MIKQHNIPLSRLTSRRTDPLQRVQFIERPPPPYPSCPNRDEISPSPNQGKRKAPTTPRAPPLAPTPPHPSTIAIPVPFMIFVEDATSWGNR